MGMLENLPPKPKTHEDKQEGVIQPRFKLKEKLAIRDMISDVDPNDLSEMLRTARRTIELRIKDEDGFRKFDTGATNSPVRLSDPGYGMGGSIDRLKMNMFFHRFDDFEKAIREDAPDGILAAHFENFVLMIEDLGLEDITDLIGYIVEENTKESIKKIEEHLEMGPEKEAYEIDKALLKKKKTFLKLIATFHK